MPIQEFLVRLLFILCFICAGFGPLNGQHSSNPSIQNAPLKSQTAATFADDSLQIAFLHKTAQDAYNQNVLDSIKRPTDELLTRVASQLQQNGATLSTSQYNWLLNIQVSSLYLNGTVLYEKGYPDSALVPINEAITLAEKHKATLPNLLSSLYARASNIYLVIGQFNTASTYANQSLRAIQEQYPQDSTKWIRPLMAKNNIYSQQNHFREAIAGYRYMLTICDDSTTCSPNTHYSIKYNLANSFYRYNDFWAALPIYQEVINYCKSAGRKAHYLHAVAHYSLAGCYGTMGMFDEALNAMHQSIHFYRQINPEDNLDLADCYSDLAILYDQVGQQEYALRYARQALDLRKRILGTLNHPSIVQSLKTIGDTYENIGDVSGNQNHYRSCLSYVDSILSIIEQDSQWSGLPKAIYLRDKATLLLKLGDNKNNELLLRSLVHNSTLRSSLQVKSEQRGAILTDYARHFFRIGQLDSALYWAHQSQEAFCPTDISLQPHQPPSTFRTSYYPMLLHGLETKIKALAKLKPEAVPAIGQYGHRLIDSLRQAKSSNEDLVRLAYNSNQFYQTFINYSSQHLPVNQLIAVQAQDSTFERLHYYMEQNKGFIARKSVSGGVALEALPPNIASRTKELTLARGYYQRLIDDELTNCPDCNQRFIDSIYLIKVELDKQKKALKDSLKQLYPDYYALIHDAKHYSLSDVQAFLKAQSTPTAVISYSLQDTILTTFVHTPKQTGWYRKTLTAGYGDKSLLELQIDSLRPFFSTVKGSLNHPD